MNKLPAREGVGRNENRGGVGTGPPSPSVRTFYTPDVSRTLRARKGRVKACGETAAEWMEVGWLKERVK